MDGHNTSFQLSRYFSIASLITIIAAALLLGWIYRSVAVEDLKEQGERHNVILAQTLFNVIAPQIHAFIGEDASPGHRDITSNRNEFQLRTFRDSIAQLAANTPILKVQIFDLSGRTVYSTDHPQIGHVMPPDYPGSVTAHTGEIVTQLDFRQNMQTINGSLHDRQVLSSYMPLRDPATDDIEGVFEIYTDVTELYDRIIASRNNFAIGVIVILGSVYLILFLLVRRADLVIRRQATEREQHLQEIERINKDLDQYARDLARTRDKALEASSAKSQFLANMSHELRTPLNAIIGYSEMLAEDMEAQSELQVVDDLKKIQGAGRHLLTVINDILDLSKIEARSMELALEDFDIAGLIEEIATTIQPLADRTGNELAVDCPAKIGSMHSDATRVRQVLFNLLGNACKFTDDGRISLQAKRFKAQGVERIRFTVRDTGIGMTPEQIKKVFKPFKQADASTTRLRGGTGLGLTISKRFTEMLGGEISVTSEPGKGTTFVVTLPAAAQQPATAAAPEKEMEAERPETGADPSKQRFSADYSRDERRRKISRVLVIDDDPAVRDLYQRYLRKEGFEVKVTTSGTDGIRSATVWRPDVIVLDVMMPEMDGWETLQIFKQDPNLRDIPVVMVTMLGEKEMGKSLGASDHLTKPIDWHRLGDVIKKWVRMGTAKK